MKKRYTEDNDTGESEEEEDEEEAKTTSAEDTKLNDMLADGKATMRDSRKDIMFLMNKEKKEIRMHQAIDRAVKLRQKTKDLDAPKKWFEDE